MTTTQIKKAQAAAPTGCSANPVAGGGTFTAGAKYWKITACGAWGESIASAEFTATLALNGHADLAWTGLPAGTTGINVYRGPTGAEDHLIASLSGAPMGCTDTGAVGAVVSPPATSAWASVTKTGIVPAKSNVPAGTPAGLAQQLVQGMTEWLAGGGTGAGPIGKIAAKTVAGAGFALQEA
jgi:hypothetical protein